MVPMVPYSEHSLVWSCRHSLQTSWFYLGAGPTRAPDSAPLTARSLQYVRALRPRNTNPSFEHGVRTGEREGSRLSTPPKSGVLSSWGRTDPRDPAPEPASVALARHELHDAAHAMVSDALVHLAVDLAREQELERG